MNQQYSFTIPKNKRHSQYKFKPPYNAIQATRLLQYNNPPQSQSSTWLQYNNPSQSQSSTLQVKSFLSI